MPIQRLLLDLSGMPAVRLSSIGWHDMEPGGWELRGALNAHWTFYRNDRAGAVLHAAGMSLPMAAGRLVLVPGGCRFNSNCTAHLRHLYGYFDVPGILRHRFEQLTHPLVAPACDEDVVLRTLATAPGVMPTPSLALRLAARLGRALADTLPAMVLEGSNDRNDLVTPACRLIDEQYAQPLTLADFARACGMSINTFLRHFRTATGTTPAQAVRRRRIQAVAMELVQGDMSLDGIARTCGFTNRHYLSRVFSSIMGMNPGAYRRRNRHQGCHMEPDDP